METTAQRKDREKNEHRLDLLMSGLVQILVQTKPGELEAIFLAALRDMKFSPEELESLANKIGRYAHNLARAEQ